MSQSIDQETLPSSLLRLKPGDPIEIGVLRGDDFRQFTVVPTERVWQD